MAIWASSTSSDSFLFLACTFRMARRPFWSGTSTLTYVTTTMQGDCSLNRWPDDGAYT